MGNSPVTNMDDLDLMDIGNGEGFAAKINSFGSAIGSKGIGCMLTVVEPGKKAFPFHVHHIIDELFVIMEGEGTYRFGDQEYPVKAGSVCAAPVGGAEHAHQIINTGKDLLKYLSISTDADTEVVEYPDSGKFAVMSRYDRNSPEAGGIRHIARPENPLDYYDGEK